MELDELKANWKSVNDRLGRLEEIQAVAAGRRKSNRLRAEPIFELVVAILTVVWCGNFLADHWSKVVAQPVGAIPAVLLDLLGIFQLGLAIRQIAMVSQLDYSGSVLSTQAQLARLKALRVRSTQFAFLVALPLWMVFPIVAGQAVIGFEFYRAVNGPWLVGNLVFGAVASLGLVLAARRFGDRSGFFRFVGNVFAGTEILRAQRELSELDAFSAG